MTMIMKKIYALLAVAAALVSSASCNKIENGDPENQEINIHVNVADFSTKAVKTSWSNGDKINIWFDGALAETPHLIITYDGTKWVSGSLDETAKAALKTDDTGTFKYLYEAGNNIGAYTIDFGDTYSFPNDYIGSQEYFSPVLTLCSPDTDPNYAYDGSDLTLNLNDWCYITNAQVVVTGLSGDPEDWYLSVKTGSGDTWCSIQDFRNDPAGFSYGIASSYTIASRGTSNGDGVESGVGDMEVFDTRAGRKCLKLDVVDVCIPCTGGTHGANGYILAIASEAAKTYSVFSPLGDAGDGDGLYRLEGCVGGTLHHAHL